MHLCVMQCISDFGSKTKIFRRFHLFYAFYQDYALIATCAYRDSTVQYCVYCVLRLSYCRSLCAVTLQECVGNDAVELNQYNRTLELDC